MTSIPVIAVRASRVFVTGLALVLAAGCAKTEAPRQGAAGDSPKTSPAPQASAPLSAPKDEPPTVAPSAAKAEEPRVTRGTSSDQPASPVAEAVMPGEKEYRLFKDHVSSNWKTGDGLDVTFVDGDGKPVDLKQYRGKKNVVLVMTRGYAGMVCPYCTAQTSRLTANIDEFTRRDAQVLAVWPGATDHVKDFVDAVQSQLSQKKPIPFPLWLDKDFKAVDALGIRGELARPSTYILDKSGKVRFAYVGSTLTDRPSVKSMLEQLDKIVKTDGSNS